MGIKIVAVDMDGTLLNNNKEKPAGFIPWVKAHPQVRMAIASGRQYYNLLKDFEEIRDQLTFLADNGGFIFEKGEMVYSNCMSLEGVHACLNQVLPMEGVTPIVCGARSAYMIHGDPIAEREADRYYARMEFVEDLYAAAAGDQITKVALFIHGGRAEEVGKNFRCSYPGHCHTISGVDWIDVSNEGINKGKALEEICRQHGITRQERMAFGDFMNDYEMLSVCEESYAMENACEALKAIAKHIAPSNEEEGVMQILQKTFPETVKNP